MSSKARETSLNVRLSDEEAAHLDKLAANWGVSRSFVIRLLLRSTPTTASLVAMTKTIEDDDEPKNRSQPENVLQFSGQRL